MARIFCIACGGSRDEIEPPCTCLRDATEHLTRTEVEITVPGGKVSDDGKFIEIPLTRVSFEPNRRLVVKIAVETSIGELLAVHEVWVRDDLMGPGDSDRLQDAFMDNVKRAATAAYIEAVGK